MFRAHRAHRQERQIVSIQPLVTVTLCWWPCRVHTTRSPTQSDSYQRLYWYNLSLLTMSSKHVESYKNKYIGRNLCVTLVIYQELFHTGFNTSKRCFRQASFSNEWFPFNSTHNYDRALCKQKIFLPCQFKSNDILTVTWKFYVKKNCHQCMDMDKIMFGNADFHCHWLQAACRIAFYWCNFTWSNAH